MPKNIPTKIEHQTVLFACMQPESSPHHLVIEARRHRGTQQSHAVDMRSIEAGRQDIDVAEVLKLP